MPENPGETRKCWGCDETIGISEKSCPKCKLDLAIADEEDSIVERAWARLKKKRDAAKAKKDDPPQPNPTNNPMTKSHPFKALASLINKKGN